MKHVWNVWTLNFSPNQVLMMAVLAILIAAPIGAVVIALGGPRMLKHCPHTVSFDIEKSFLEGDRVKGLTVNDGTNSTLLPQK